MLAVRRRRAGNWALTFALLSLAAALWAFGYAFELGAASQAAKVLWARFQYIGIAAVPLAWFMFAMQYTGFGAWLTRRTILLISLIPFATVLLVFTNEAHQLIWRTIELQDAGLFTGLDFTYGIWFWGYLGYSYLLLLAGTLLMLWSYVRFPRPIFQWHNLTFLIGVILPWIANAVYILELSPLPQLDLSPFGLAVSALVFFVSIFRFSLFDIVPVARRHVLDHVIDGVITLDLRHRIVDVNRAAERILEWSSEKVIGRQLTKMLQAHRTLARNIVATTGGEQPRNIEMKIDNSYYDVQVSPLKDAREQIYAWALVMHDVTGRKHTELELAHARDRAVEVSEAKSHFLARVSHELRTPLSVILGYVEMLMEHAEDAEFLAEHKPVQKIYESIQYLNIQVNELLDLSSLDAGRLRLEKLPVDLAELVDEVQSQMSILARNKHIRLSSVVDDDLPKTIISDPLRLKQIMINLAGNAIKFTEKGGVAVHAARSGEKHWTLQVSDTGPGIPELVRDTIFEPFQQGPGALTRTRAGSGLGLAIVAELTQLMRGSIDLDSSPGEGSTFTIRLPLKSGEGNK